MRTQQADQSRPQEDIDVDSVERENEGFWLSFHGFRGMYIQFTGFMQGVAMRATENVIAPPADPPLTFSA
jgi:hypothetical protein